MIDFKKLQIGVGRLFVVVVGRGLVVAFGFSFVVAAASHNHHSIISFTEEVAASSSAADGVKDYYCCNICYDRQSYNGRARSGGDS